MVPEEMPSGEGSWEDTVKSQEGKKGGAVRRKSLDVAERMRKESGGR